jgi:hypothetical protein
MHQKNIRFSGYITDENSASHEDTTNFHALPCTRNAPLTREDNRAATQKSRASTQNKVLVIMDYGIFRKQAYRGTGSQRDSRPEVTDSIQRRIEFRGIWSIKRAIEDAFDLAF